MDDYEKETKLQIDAIPKDLKDRFVPSLKENFSKISNLMKSIEDGTLSPSDPNTEHKREKYLKSMEKLSEDFVKAGGTDIQWNILAPAIANGVYDRIYSP